MAATVSHVAERVDRTIKSIIPAEQEPKLEEGKAILRRYLNPPFGFTMENEIAKARNVIKNLKDFPAYIDGKVSTCHDRTCRTSPLLIGQRGWELLL